MSEKMSKFLIPLSIVLAGIIIAGTFYFVQNKGSKEDSTQVIADRAIAFITENFGGGNEASLISISETESGVLKIHLALAGNEYDSYVTKDGKFLFPEGYELEAGTGEASGGTSVDIPKEERPDVKLFVMSYCPYGLQAQKMFLPVYDLLKDKAEMGVYFVDYIMHEKAEISENLRQYCIQQEEKDKYSDYLSCFVVSDDAEGCLSQTSISRGAIENCIFETDRDFNVTALYNNKETWLSGAYPQFPVQADLNEEYGVQGSPTIIINGQTVNVSPRSPENFKNIICQAFSSQPEECSQTLSNEVASPGIGSGTSSGSNGSCQ